MKRMLHKITVVIVAVSLCLASLQGCERAVGGPDGNTLGASVEKGESEAKTAESDVEASTAEGTVTKEPTTEEPTADEPITEEPTTEEPTTQEPFIEMEISFEAAKKEIVTLFPGNGEGQVGYSTEGLAELKVGPEAFAVENGIVYVLDVINNRVIICDDGNYSYIDVSEYWRVRYMGFDNGRIGVAGYLNRQGVYQIIAVYSPDGIKEEQMTVATDGFINEIIAIDEGGVKFESTGGTRYTYDWKTKRLDVVRKTPDENVFWAGEQKAYILGYGESATYYMYRKGTYDFIGKEISNIGRWYVAKELLTYRTLPLDSLYVSADGRLYLMECYDDRTVISELVLGSE